jgi:acyl-CoA thioesterase FadM
MTSYHTSCFIPFHLADPAGIVFFGHVFSLAHQAYEQFISDQLGYTWTEWFQNPEWIVPIKQADAHYLHPLVAGQSCHMELHVTALSSTSFTLTSSLSQQQVCCTVKTLHVFCRKATKHKMPIPPPISLKIHSFLNIN